MPTGQLFPQPIPGFLGGVDAQTGTSYTIVSSDLGKLITFSNAGAIAVTLPVAATNGFGSKWYVDIENLGAGAVTITPTTSTIDGVATLVLNQNQGVRIFCDGTNYNTQRGMGGGSGGGFSGTSVVTTATYTLVAGDNSKVKIFTNAGGCTVTAPAQTGTWFCVISCRTTGNVVINGSGVTIDGSATAQVNGNANSGESDIFLFWDGANYRTVRGWAAMRSLYDVNNSSLPFADGVIPQNSTGTGKFEMVVIPVRICGGVPGTLPNGIEVMGFPVDYPIVFPANFTGSAGGFGFNGVHPAASATITVYKGALGSWTQIGTVTISIGGAFTFATTAGAQQTANTGDMITAVGPNPADAALASSFMTLVAFRGTTLPVTQPSTPFITFRGDWSNVTTYATYDEVRYNSNVYLAKQPNTNQSPSGSSADTAYWWFVVGAANTASVDIQNETQVYATDTGIANAYAGTYSPVITTAIAGTRLRLKIAHTNTTASTFNPGSGVVAIKKFTSAGITDVVAGDLQAASIACFVYDGTQWLLQNPAVTSSGMVLLATLTPSAAATAVFTGFSSTYKTYLILVSGMTVNTNNASLWMRMSTDGGATYDSTAGHYSWGEQVNQAAAGPFNGGSASDTKIQLIDSQSNAVTNEADATYWLSNPLQSTLFTSIHGEVVYDTGAPTWTSLKVYGKYIQAASVNAIQFLLSGGTFSGTITVYGMLK